MMRKRAILIIFPLLFSACSKYKDNGSPSAGPVQKAKDLHMYEMKDSTRTWTLDSIYAEIYDGKEMAYLTNPIIKFQEKGKTTSEIVSLKGDLDIKEKEAIFTQNVVAKSFTDNIIVKTEILHYSFKHEKIWTDDFVEVTQNDTIVHGKGLEAKPDMSEIIIKKQQTNVPKQMKK